MNLDDAAAWLQAWDQQGIHRTATPGDAAGADWLAHTAASFGVAVASEEFALERIDPVEAHLELDGVRIPAVPVFDAPPTGTAGIAGALGPSGSDAPLGVVELSPHAVYSGEYRSLRNDTAWHGMVIVCRGEHPGLGLLNAEEFRNPYGVPAIHLPSDAREVVFAAATRGAQARLVADHRRTRARARNVVVTIPGRDRTRAPVVVMTPRSSWWQSTAERGGGLVCWLETLRALVATAPDCDVVLTANSGHELGHLGLDDFLARRPGWDRPVADGGATWVHYGANLGAVGGRLSVLSTSDDLRGLIEVELPAAGRNVDVMAPKMQVPSGETRDIHRAGGRYVTLVGTNAWFHLPQDRWPHRVDAGAVARIAAAAARMVVALTR